jgi:histidinol-phosphate/aromatic aminotransferase/cobyric acid decarboxylase-like protein
MNSLAHVLKPPAGGSFALPETAPSSDFQREILKRVSTLSWNRYPSVSTEALQRTPWDFSASGATTLFARRAEQAILEVLRSCAARRVLIPEYSYPGYARVCSAIGAQVATYSDEAQLLQMVQSPATVETVMVVTAPGNPIDTVQPMIDVRSADPRVHLLVDAAYAVPFGDEFRATVSWWLERGAAVAFTLSKLACLAATRFGGVIRPSGAFPRLQQEQKYWDLLSTALIDAFGDPRVVAMVLALSGTQQAIGANLVRLLEVAHIPVFGRGGGCFATVPFNLIAPEIREALSAKDFRDVWTRIDASPHNIDVLRGRL